MMELLTLTKKGLYCPQGDFYIDAHKKVPINVVTHGHTDHARSGSDLYIATPETCSLIQMRYKKAVTEPLTYTEQRNINGVTISLHPAGHVLGSAQIRIEYEGHVWLVTGDYKRQNDPTCAPFEIVKCDVMITEATFGDPKYEWPDATKIFDSAANWIKKNKKDNITSVLQGYSLGKAQRVLRELEQRGIEKIKVHEQIHEINEIYRQHGHKLENAQLLDNVSSGDVLLMPPGSKIDLEVHESAFFSGWILHSPWSAKQAQGFIISDHADFPELIRTALESGAKRVLTTHGFTRELAHALKKHGLASYPLDEKPLQQKITEFLYL